MDWVEALILVGMFLIRILLPAAILLGLGFLYEYLLERHTTLKDERPAGMLQPETPAPVITIRTINPVTPDILRTPACWEIMNCPVEQRAVCPAAQRQGVPCWVTMQLLTGQLPDRCLTCPIFTETSQYADIQEPKKIKE